MMRGLQVRHRSPHPTRCTPQPCREPGLFLVARGKHQQSGFGVGELVCLTPAALPGRQRFGSVFRGVWSTAGREGGGMHGPGSKMFSRSCASLAAGEKTLISPQPALRPPIRHGVTPGCTRTSVQFGGGSSGVWRGRTPLQGSRAPLPGWLEASQGPAALNLPLPRAVWLCWRQ